ncbi:MAG: AI-2E family transporter [Candidatus Woesearchaeota archaeon]
MDPEKLSQATFILLLLLVAALSVLVVWPFLLYIIFSLILGYIFYPVYVWLLKRLKSEVWTAGIMIILLLIIIIVPGALVTAKLIPQTQKALFALGDAEFFSGAEHYIASITGKEISLTPFIQSITENAKTYLVQNATKFISSAADVALGIFVMFFVLYYTFRKGPEIFQKVTNFIPLKKKHRETIVDEIKRVTHAVVNGQILVAIVQGVLGGIGFAMFGVPNPVFWGFIMMVLSLLPVVGPPMVWAPAAIYLFMTGQIGMAIAMFIWGLVLVSGIDNFLKPKLMASQGKIHPIIALVGVLGGLKVFGFMGFVIGPLILALGIAFIRFVNEDNAANKTV